MNEIESVLVTALNGGPSPSPASAVPKIEVESIEEDRRGSQRLIEHTNSTLSKVHDVAISHIDEMITKLQRIKTAIECKRDQTRDKIADFIRTVAQGLQGVEELDEKISKLEEQHLNV